MISPNLQTQDALTGRLESQQYIYTNYSKELDMGRVHPQVGSGHSASSASEFEKTHETKQENVFTFLDFEKPKKNATQLDSNTVGL